MDIQAKDLDEFRAASGVQRSPPRAVRALHVRRGPRGLRRVAPLQAGRPRPRPGADARHPPPGRRRAAPHLLPRHPGGSGVGDAAAAPCGTTSGWEARCWARPSPASGWASCSSIVFSVRLGWLPTGGTGGLAPLRDAGPRARRLLCRPHGPAHPLGRCSTTLGEDYILTARAKGLAELVVVAKHTLKNAAIPIVTLAGLETGQLLGGAVITETIFAWPGVGRLTVQALLNRDFPVVLAAVFVASLTYTLINLVVDLLYGWIDPARPAARAERREASAPHRDAASATSAPSGSTSRARHRSHRWCGAPSAARWLGAPRPARRRLRPEPQAAGNSGASAGAPTSSAAISSRA